MHKKFDIDIGDFKFREIFSSIMGAASTQLAHYNILKASWLDTPLGSMIAIADERALYLLEFVDRQGLERKIERLKEKTKSAIIPGRMPPIDSITREMTLYFEGKLEAFTTALCPLGSPFQQQVWEALCHIPFGHTRSYAEIAATIGNPSACRAVAQANGANQLTLIIPCHRVINSTGKLGGYGGGVARKEWLIHHEEKYDNSRQ